VRQIVAVGGSGDLALSMQGSRRGLGAVGTRSVVRTNRKRHPSRTRGEGPRAAETSGPLARASGAEQQDIGASPKTKRSRDVTRRPSPALSRPLATASRVETWRACAGGQPRASVEMPFEAAGGHRSPISVLGEATARKRAPANCLADLLGELGPTSSRCLGRRSSWQQSSDSGGGHQIVGSSS